MTVDQLILFLQSHHPNQINTKILEQKYPHIVEEISNYFTDTLYPLSFESKRKLLREGFTAIPLCETCGEPINRYKATLPKISRFCSLSCAYKGQRMTDEQIEKMRVSSQESWTIDRRERFAQKVRQAHLEGKYTDVYRQFTEKRRHDPVFRALQKQAASISQRQNNRMNVESFRNKMIESKRLQFSEYELPSWYHRGQFSQACYNPLPIPLYLRLIEDLQLEGPYYFGDHEKKLGRYFIDFYSEKEQLAIEWNEPPHYRPRQRIKDINRMNVIKQHNPTLILIEIDQRDICPPNQIIWGDSEYIKFRQKVLDLWIK